MRKTDDVVFRLESLKGKMCLGSRVDRDGWDVLKGTYLYYLCGWQEELVKPMIGKERLKIVKLEVIMSEHVDTEYVGFFDSNLEFHLNRMENERRLFKELHRDLIGFGFTIQKKQEKV